MDISTLLHADSIVTDLGLVGILAILFAETGLLIGLVFPGDSLLFVAGVAASGSAASVSGTATGENRNGDIRIGDSRRGSAPTPEVQRQIFCWNSEENPILHRLQSSDSSSYKTARCRSTLTSLGGNANDAVADAV